MRLQHLPTIAFNADSSRPNLRSRLSDIRFDRALLCSTALAGLLAILPPATPAQAQSITTGGEVLTPTAAVPAGAQPHPWNVSELFVVGNVSTGSLDIEGGGIVNGSGSIVGNALTGRGTVTVSGLGSVWNTGTAGFSLIVGNEGGGELNIVSRGKVNADGLVILGNVEGSSGTIVVDSGGEFTTTDVLVVGEEGAGSLAIRNGTVSSFRGAIGRGSGSGGAVTVSGPFSTWTNSDVLIVGGSGSGVLYIENGGSVSNTHSSIGGTPDSVGVVRVSGSGSTWTNNGNVDVGYEGSGTLHILEGGVVSTFNAHVGTAADSSGTVTVDGNGSKWTNAANLFVGDAGTGTLDIRNGGIVTNTLGFVGAQAGSSGSVTVDGEGSQWSNAGSLTVGGVGSGTLAITGGGDVFNAIGYVGFGDGSEGAVTVDGVGSTWTNLGSDLYVGVGGRGNLSVSDGGEVFNRFGYVGTNPGSEGTVTVRDAGSAWKNDGDLHVGYAGTADMIVTDAGYVSNANGYIGVSDMSVGAVTVERSGFWENDVNLYVGESGQGTLTIRDGGIVHSGFGYIGNQLGSAGTVNVDGLGSVWQMSAGNLYVGSDGAGALNITNGGSVSNIDAFVGEANVGSVVVDGAQSAWTNRVLYVGVGGIGSLAISGGGRVDAVTSGIGIDPGSTGSAVVDGAGSLWFTSGLFTIGSRGDGVLTVANGGTVEVAGVGIWLGNNGGQGRINIGADPVTSSATAPGTLDTAAVSFQSPSSALTFNHTGTNYTFAPELRGDGLVSHFAGTTIVTANSGLFTGATDVIGGTLRVDGTLGGTGSTVTVASGGILAGGGTIGGDVTVASGGILAGTAGSTLTMNSLGLDAGANVNVSLGAPSTTGLFNVATNLSLDGTLNVTDQPGFGAGLYRIFDYGGTLTDNGLEVGTTPMGYSAGNLTVQTAIAGQVNLLAGTPVIPLTFWNGNVTTPDGTIHGGTGTWDRATTNWTDATGTSSGPYDPAGLLIFAGAPGTVTVDAGAGPIVMQTGMQFAADGYTIIGDDIGLTGATVIRVGDGTATGAGFTATIDSDLTGAGSLEKIDLGTLVLTGANTYTGDTIVNGGSLLVDGTLAGDVFVNTGATLGGVGSLGGQVTVRSGGTLAPGNSIGTLNVADATFDAGSIYRVELNDGGFVAGTNNDLLNASGTVTINGGIVHVTPENGTDNGTTYLPGTYTIVTAAAGVTGTFDTVTDDFAFLDFTHGYDANNVFLTSSIGVPGFCLDGYTANQCATGEGVFSLGSGSLYTAVLNLSTTEAPVALDQLSGEIHASAQTALIDDSRFVREAAMDRLRMALDEIAADRNGVVERRIHDGFAFWGRGFGSWGGWDGDGNAAALDRSVGGFFLGGDALVTENLRLGVFGGHGHSRFEADERNATGSADTWHLGAYGGTEFGNLGLRFGGAYAWHDIETHRSVAFTGFSDNLSGRYDAGTGQIFGEAGYRFDYGTASFEPFAGLAYVHHSTDGYAESGGAAALAAGSQSMDTTFTTIGLRAQTQVDIGETKARFFGMAGWRHAFGDVTPLATHAFAGGDDFTVAGVPIARDALVLDLGAAVDLTPSATLGVSYSGQFGSGQSDQGIKANLAVRF